MSQVTNDDYGTTFVAPARISDPATEGAEAGWTITMLENYNAALDNTGAKVQRQSKLASLTFPALKAVTGGITIKDNTALARAVRAWDAPVLVGANNSFVVE